MWTSAPSLTVDVSRRAAMRTARIRAAVKLASFSRPTAKSATVSDRRRTLCVCVCVCVFPWSCVPFIRVYGLNLSRLQAGSVRCDALGFPTLIPNSSSPHLAGIRNESGPKIIMYDAIHLFFKLQSALC